MPLSLLCACGTAPCEPFNFASMGCCPKSITRPIVHRLPSNNCSSLWQVEAIKQRPDVQLVTLTRDNRDRETQAVLAELQRRLQTSGGGSGGRGGG